MENLPLNEQDFIPLGASASEGEVLACKPMTYWQDAWQRFRKNKVALFAAILLVIIALFTIFGPAICGYDFAAQNVKIRNQAPSAEHWFGTDSLGRDLFARVAVGGRVSIIIGICGALIVGVIGCLYGGLAAYFGGRVDMVMMRIVDILSSIPNLLLVILLSVVLESSSIPTLLFAMTITSWCGVARIVRAQMLQINRSEYVMAARIMGVSPIKIVLTHFIPNTISVIIVNLTFRIPGFIFSEAFLSYVGLGVAAPNTSWGALASAAQSTLLFYPYQMLFPSLFIALTTLSFTLMGDGLRDALDPKMRR